MLLPGQLSFSRLVLKRATAAAREPRALRLHPVGRRAHHRYRLGFVEASVTANDSSLNMFARQRTVNKGYFFFETTDAPPVVGEIIDVKRHRLGRQPASASGHALAYFCCQLPSLFW